MKLKVSKLFLTNCLKKWNKGGIFVEDKIKPEDKWIKPDDPLILEQLEWFKDLKLGLMIHWGPYSQLGIVESWALSDADAEWARKGLDWEKDPAEFKRQYFELNKTFNPIRFQPEKWAELAQEGGFKYLIFTTKHHDGFCMWDTKYTDYKITSPECPFHKHKYADICKNLFNAFRERGLAIAAYFSKADWHSPYYWAKGMKQSNFTNRGPTYNPLEYPWLWEEFVKFTHNQIVELVSKYGRIDILWLDAGWVCPQNNQDIKMDELVQKIRKIQPWILVVDRWVGGPHENYLTPEQTIPERPILVPWESCITMGTSFSYCYDDNYKSVRELVLILIEIVAKGGNLALNVGAQPDGRLPTPAILRMKELGKWLKKYGEAIYSTRPCEPYFTGEYAFTKKDDCIYCFKLYKSVQIEEYMLIPFTGEKIVSVELIGHKENLYFEQTDKGLKIKMPADAYDNLDELYAHVFKLKYKR